MNMNEVISYKKFGEIELEDPLFDSLKNDYPKFETWFLRKAQDGEEAIVQYDGDHLCAFLYLKIENDVVDDVVPVMPEGHRLKIGTFKIDAHNTRLGERFMKKIVDYAVIKTVDEIYVTIFPRSDGQKALIRLLKEYGFEEYGTKKETGELVFVKKMTVMTGNMLKDYPMICPKGKRKFILAIYPKYHTQMFPDSILNNEQISKEDLIRDVSYTNSIHKIYLSFIQDTATLTQGDIIVIYRTGDNLGPAYYRSVVTSVCQVEEVRTKRDFTDITDFTQYTNKYSIFNPEDLKYWYQSKKFVVIKMTYNMALTKRLNRAYLLNEVGISAQQYWGFLQLTDEQFNKIIETGASYENIIINKA